MAKFMLIAFILTIAIGFIANMNQGIIALIVSYIAGCFIMGMKPAEVLAMWPMRIFFILLATSLFYNFATLNGTLDKLSLNILHKFGKQAKLFPIVGFMVAAVMSALGAGPYSVITLLCPILFVIGEKTGMSKLMLGVGICLGAVGAGAFPTCSSGAVINGIISDIGYADKALSYSFLVFGEALISFFIIYLLMYFFMFKGHKITAENIALDVPEPFDPVQKKTLILIAVFVLANLLPSILNVFIKTDFIAMLAKYNDVGFIAMILSGVAIAMKLADEQKAIKAIPWKTIIMVGGISILVSIAVESGTIDLLVSAVNSTGSKAVVPGLMSGIASVMSLFSSSTGVVLPTLYPTVPQISGATGLAPALLLAVINTGSGLVSVSPLSACGALVLGCVPENEASDIYKKLFMIAGICFACGLVISTVLGLIWPN